MIRSQVTLAIVGVFFIAAGIGGMVEGRKKEAPMDWAEAAYGGRLMVVLGVLGIVVGIGIEVAAVWEW